MPAKRYSMEQVVAKLTGPRSCRRRERRSPRCADGGVNTGSPRARQLARERPRPFRSTIAIERVPEYAGRYPSEEDRDVSQSAE